MAGTEETKKTVCLYTNYVDRQIVALDTVVFGEETPLDVWNSKPGIAVITIDEGERTVAYLAFYKAENALHIWKTGVHPEHTEKGFFKRMLNHVFRLGREKDLDITIGTQPSRFPVMHSILERHTCERFDRQPPKEGFVYYKWKKGSY